MSDFDWDHLDIDEEEGDEATGEDDDDPAVEDGDVFHDGQVHQGEVRSIRGDASKVRQVFHLDATITFARTMKMGFQEKLSVPHGAGRSFRFQVLHREI